MLEEGRCFAYSVIGSHYRQQCDSFSCSAQVLQEARPLARAVVVVITDGASTTRRSTYEAARLLREDDVRLVWLYITENATYALWREKSKMADAGDATLDVVKFDDLGEDVVKNILIPTCRGERFANWPVTLVTSY